MGIFTKAGNHLIINDEDGKSDMVTDLGDTSFSYNDMGFLNDGQVVKTGDTFLYNGKTYSRVGNTLIGPNGRSWQGVGNLTDSDVRGIILHDSKKHGL